MNTIQLNGSKNQKNGLRASQNELDVNNTGSQIVMFYSPSLSWQNVESMGHYDPAFSEVFNQGDVKQLKKYLKEHRLSASEEYQMIVLLGMEMTDEETAEKIILSYVRRFGLCSQKSYEALEALGFSKVLKALKTKRKVDVKSNDEPSVVEKLRDGFMMFHDQDIAQSGFFVRY